MKYYSTNKQAPLASLEEAVVKGLASDKGLFMPMTIKPLPQEFYDEIENLSFREIAYRVADAFFGEDVPAETLKEIVYDTLNFDVPLVPVKENIYSLELFHGPTLAFKDVGGRFMARLLGYFIRKEGRKQVNVLVATSGDTGSAVANGFLGVLTSFMGIPPCVANSIPRRYFRNQRFEANFAKTSQILNKTEEQGDCPLDKSNHVDYTEHTRRCCPQWSASLG